MTYATRELDERVAKILWPQGHIGHPEHPAHGRAYSSDWRCVPEMLAWLDARKDYASFNACTWHVGLRPGKPEWVWSVTMHYVKPDPRLNITRHGTILPEAIARLVVAVADASVAS